MSIVFRHRVIRVYANADAVTKALKETACNAAPNYLANTFSECSFHYSMRGAIAADGIFASARISGTMEAQGDVCIIRYCMRPASLYFTAPVMVTVMCLCDLIKKFPETKVWYYIAVSALAWLIFSLTVSWRETAFEERILQKLNEADKYHDVGFSS